jgi:O-antigen/teichoic acid export membrane protein
LTVKASEPSIKRNLIATYISQGWVALMGVAFVPLYVRYLGIEAYGLIGAFSVIYSLLVFLDFGVSPTLMREVSRFTGGASSATEIRNLLRTAEAIAFTISALILLGLWLSSGWLAVHWFKASKLDPSTVTNAVKAMGLVASLRFVESIYRGTITGLQSLTLLGALNALAATLRGLGAVAVLAFVSNSIGAFFLWQAAVSVLSLAVLASATYASLPKGNHAARPSLQAARGVVGFASGMMLITILSLGLTQADKLILSTLLPLAEFGRYSLAALVAVSLEMIAEPAFRAFGPRFAKLHAAGDEAGLALKYHQAAQLVSIIAGSAAVVLIFFAQPFLSLWTRDPRLAEQTAPILQVLALGYLLNLCVFIPYLAQLAHGWTSLTVRVASVALAIVIPALLWIVPRYGAIGAAWVWTALNATYFVVIIHFMHRQILKQEKWHWYARDVFCPIASAIIGVGLIRLAIPLDRLSPLGIAAVLVLAACTALVLATMSSPVYRAIVSREVLERRKRQRRSGPITEKGNCQ